MNTRLENLNERIKILRKIIEAGLKRAYDIDGKIYCPVKVSLHGATSTYSTYAIDRLSLKAAEIERQICLFEQDTEKFSDDIKRLKRALRKNWAEIQSLPI